MNFRSSNSVAALALLMATEGCALFAPAAHAGDRLEFSTPAIPLAVPRPEVETKEPKKMTGSQDLSAGMAGATETAPQQQTLSAKSTSKDKYDLDANPILGKDQDKRDADDWFTARPEETPKQATNSSSSNMPHGWDAKASDGSFQRRNDGGFEAGQTASRFGSQIGSDRYNVWDGDHKERDSDRFGRNSERYGRETSSDKDGLFWLKKYSQESSGTDRFNGARFTPFKDESGILGLVGGAHDSRVTMPVPVPGAATDSAHNMALPPGFENYTPFDDSQNRQTGEQFGEQAGANQGLRAWEPPPSSRLPARNSSNPGQTSRSQVGAPNRPVNLPFPKRPDSPF
jgi:hypothetical protein